MKKVITLLSFALVLFTACEGPAGPPGLDGSDGISGEGLVFETFADFNPDRNYSTIIDFPVDVFPEDTVIVYRGIDDNDVGEVWEPLPTIVFTDNGSFQYIYNYNQTGIEISINSEFDPALINPNDRINQRFRIAIIPSTFIQSNKIDTTDMADVLSYIDSIEVK